MIIYQKNQQVIIWLQLQNHDAMWHINIFCHYSVIIMVK
jgi:hypothetical protein